MKDHVTKMEVESCVDYELFRIPKYSKDAITSSLCSVDDLASLPSTNSTDLRHCYSSTQHSSPSVDIASKTCLSKVVSANNTERVRVVIYAQKMAAVINDLRAFTEANHGDHHSLTSSDRFLLYYDEVSALPSVPDTKVD